MMKKATVADLQRLLNLIKMISPEETEYLRYTIESRTLEARLLQNIKDGHVILFIGPQGIWGFLEYTLQNSTRIWIYSLYFLKEYRHLSYPIVFPAFAAMKQCYKMPIHFTVHKDNIRMHKIAHLLKAELVTVYPDERAEYKIPEVF